MRILTVRQPYAWAIIHGGKGVENRVRSLGPYRGLVAIHAGLRWSEPGAGDQEVRRAAHSSEGSRDADDGDPDAADLLDEGDDRFVIGMVIGVVDLTDVHESRACEVEMQHVQDGPVITWRCSLWSMPDHHHLTLDNPRPLARPIPAKGRLGLWRPDADLEAAIREQIGGA